MLTGLLGNAFAPLSYLSYAVPPLPDDLPRYNPTKHLRQLGDDTEIVAVPFTVSPTAVIKRIRYLVGRRTWEGVGLDERDWKEAMVGLHFSTTIWTSPPVRWERDETRRDETKRDET
jgi:hypothetical protein